jgi:hypothetical protein
MDLDFKVFRAEWGQISKISKESVLSPLQSDPTVSVYEQSWSDRHDHAPLSTYLLHDRYSDQFWVRSSHPHLAYVLGVGGAHATPVRSYCFTVETELIRPAMLNSALPKPDGMQAVAFVPEMSHFHAQMGCIFVDQLESRKSQRDSF